MIDISDFLGILNEMLKGLSVTLWVLFGAVLVGYTLAFLTGFGRLSKNPFVNKFTIVFVEIFRGTSLVVQLFWIYYVLPPMIYSFLSFAFGIDVQLTTFQEAMTAGILGIGFNYGAYMSEVVRGSILAVQSGQHEAATALNYKNGQKMRLIILPQAVRMMLPEFGNYLIMMLKATSLVYLISLTDMTFLVSHYESNNISLMMLKYSMLLGGYFIVALPLIGLTKWFEGLASKGVAK